MLQGDLQFAMMEENKLAVVALAWVAGDKDKKNDEMFKTICEWSDMKESEIIEFIKKISEFLDEMNENEYIPKEDPIPEEFIWLAEESLYDHYKLKKMIDVSRQNLHPVIC